MTIPCASHQVPLLAEGRRATGWSFMKLLGAVPQEQFRPDSKAIVIMSPFLRQYAQCYRLTTRSSHPALVWHRLKELPMMFCLPLWNWTIPSPSQHLCSFCRTASANFFPTDSEFSSFLCLLSLSHNKKQSFSNSWIFPDTLKLIKFCI